MKKLLVCTAVIEVGAGLVLASVPSAAATMLLGSPLEQSVSITLGRVAGMALFALGVANWLAHYDDESRAARGLVMAMIAYNSGVAIVLGLAGIGPHPVGLLLWPAVFVHVGMTVWCVISLRRKVGTSVT